MALPRTHAPSLLAQGLASLRPYPFATAAVAAVPETSTWVMMILGFMSVGFIAYRRRYGEQAFVHA